MPLLNQTECDLLCFSKRGRCDDLQTLVRENGDAIAERTYGEALVLAASSGKLVVCQWLLERGTNVDYVGYRGRTALAYAKQEKRRSVIQLLEQFDANDDTSATTFEETEYDQELFRAAKTDQLPLLVERLSTLGLVAMDQTDPSGKTLLMHACHRGFVEMVDWLIDSGVKINTVDRSNSTALDHAFWGPLEPVPWWKFRERWRRFRHRRRQSKIRRQLVGAGGLIGEELSGELAPERSDPLAAEEQRRAGFSMERKQLDEEIYHLLLVVIPAQRAKRTRTP